MKKSFMINLINVIARKKFRFTVKSVTEYLNNPKPNKYNCKIPFFLKFPRKIKTKKYNGMKVFEMEPQQNNKKIIMYIHGGAYIKNFYIFHWLFLIKLSKKGGYGITAPNYPLLPKYTHKQSHEKVLEYYKKYSRSHNMKNVILMGDSAGGGFALSLLQKIKEAKLPLPGKSVLISPFVDAINVDKTLNDKDSIVEAEAATLAAIAWSNGDDLSLPQISPINGGLKDLPPIKIYIGTNEVLYKQCINLYERLRKVGNDVTIHIGEEMCHVYPLFPIPECKKAVSEIMEYIEK